jgi:hypothetical protein
MDNFHYGEFIGPWFNTSTLGLTPYKDIEYPRGLLVNFIPASFGNFLSPGFPETFNYWFVFLSFVLGIFFTFVMKNLLPLPLTLTLIMILPKANGYNEIDLLMLLSLMSLIIGLTDDKYRKLTSYSIIPVCVFWILMTPGQGIILLCLASVSFIYIYFLNLNKFNSFLLSRQTLIAVTITTSIVALIFQFLRPAVEWVIRNSPVNNRMFGDDWLNQALAPQDFPLSLKFSVLVIAPILFIFVISKFSLFDERSQIISITIICYLILISGRWFARVDASVMSRIGWGFSILLIILVLPLMFQLSRGKFVLNSPQIPVLGLIFAFSLSWNPFNVNSFVPSQPTTIVRDANYSLMSERGDKYQQISKLTSSIFGPKIRMLNLTGGNAIDFYLKIPGYGGIHSPYVVTNDAQEKDWLNRLKLADPNFILGSYGSLGSDAFDGSGLGGRAPQVLSWMISNYALSDCVHFLAAIPKRDLASHQIKLERGGCRFASDENENLSFWNKMDATQSELGASLLSWPVSTKFKNDYIRTSDQSIQIRMKSLSDVVGFDLKCPARGIAQFSIMSVSQKNPMNFTFSAQVDSGQYAFKAAMFPISTLLEGKFDLILKDSACIFSQ